MKLGRELVLVILTIESQWFRPLIPIFLKKLRCPNLPRLLLTSDIRYKFELKSGICLDNANFGQFWIFKKVLRPQSDLGPIYRVKKQIKTWSECYF